MPDDRQLPPWLQDTKPDDDPPYKGTSLPRSEIITAIQSGVTQVTRRVEIFEKDGETPWDPRGDREVEKRLTGGSISIDYNRGERRTLDVTLDNHDNLLRPNERHGLWYDKILKVYRGIRYDDDPRPPKICIVEANSFSKAHEMRKILNQLGFNRVDVNLNATSAHEVREYPILVSYMENGVTARPNLLVNAWENGQHIISQGFASTSAAIPLIQTAGALESTATGVEHVPYDTPVNSGWSAESYAAATGRRVTAVASRSLAVAQFVSGSTTHYTGIIKENPSGGKWFHYQPYQFGTEAKRLLNNVLLWQWDYKEYRHWEIQVGEFMIDNILAPHFPNTISVTGRDYWKKLLNSKLEDVTSFEKGTRVRQIIMALAANAGIVNFHVPPFEDVLESRLDFDRGTPRADIIKKASEAHEKEVFFNNRGTLVVRDFIDPSFDPVAWQFETGNEGNLVSFERSMNDSRIYNGVVVTGERNKGLPYHGEAWNTDPHSPTRVGRIGERPKFISSPFFNSDEHCQRYAERKLKIVALESYEMNFSSFVYPWMEVGEAIRLIDPDRTDDDPTRFLMDTITLPLGLEPMQATGKRVTYVEDTLIKAANAAAQEDVARVTTVGGGMKEQETETVITKQGETVTVPTLPKRDRSLWV